MMPVGQTPAVAPLAGAWLAFHNPFRVNSHGATANPTDAELARAVLDSPPGEARDQEDELCRRLAPRVRLYGLRHLRDEQSAADLVQRVLLITIQKLRDREVREPERITSFALGSARMATREIWRAARREEPLPVEALELPDVAQEFPEPLARDHLARCLAELRERERSVLVLTYYQEQSAQEVAGALGLKPGNVRVIRHRAIDRLRTCMGLGDEVAA